MQCYREHTKYKKRRIFLGSTDATDSDRPELMNPWRQLSLYNTTSSQEKKPALNLPTPALGHTNNLPAFCTCASPNSWVCGTDQNNNIKLCPTYP